MGRSKGDPARSKTRPSSSSLAASILQSSGGATIGFGGFVGSARVDSSLSIDGDVFSDVNGEVAVQLRRLSKKDFITKLKALATLDALFKTLSSKELVPILPYWVFEYRRLVHENNRQVRENTQKVMRNLVVGVGRGLAPHLRAVMGAWWIAQFDPCRDVADAAKESFQEAFSGQKRIEALVYCVDDIFAYLSENLKLTPQTIADKTIPLEESTEKHELVICSSLLSMAALLDVLIASRKIASKETTRLQSGSSTDGFQVVITENVELSTVERLSLKFATDHKLFRDFFKSQRPLIRSAAYQAVRALVENIPAAFTSGEMQTTAKVVLGAFAEKDDTCMQSMWDMVLTFSKTFPQAWGLEAVKKIAFPRFWAFLRHGCYGSQHVSSICLLPLVSLIPRCAILPVEEFLKEYFQSLWKGCQTGTSSDGIILLKTFKECFIWIIKNIRRYVDGESEMRTLQIFLIDAILFKILWLNYCEGRMLQGPTKDPNSETLDAKCIPESSMGGKGVVEVQLANEPQLAGTLLFTPSQFVEGLRDCLVDVLDFLSGQLSLEIWPIFQQDCLRILNIKLSKVPGNEGSSFNRMSEFLLHLGEKLYAQEGCRQTWPLYNLVQPFIASTFRTITSAEDPEAVLLLDKLVSVFGPTAFSLVDHAQFKDFTIAENLPASIENVSSSRDAGSSSSSSLRDVFRNEVIPWCLNMNHPIESFKLEFLLSFFKDGSFRSEWDFVLFYILSGYNSEDESQKSASIKRINLLAALIGHICQKKNIKCGELSEDGVQDWHSTRLDEAVLSVAQNSNIHCSSSSQLLRDAIGNTSILSCKVRVQVVEELLNHIHLPLMLSESSWTRKSAELILLKKGNAQLHQLQEVRATVELWEDAKFAIGILQHSLASTLHLGGENRILVRLLTTLFCLKWTILKPPSRDCKTDAENDVLEDYDSENDALVDYEGGFFENGLDLKDSDDSKGFYEIIDNEVGIELEHSSVLSKSLKFLDEEEFISICKSLCVNLRYSSQKILAQCVRYALFEESENYCHKHVDQWALDMIVYFCVDAEDVQKALDLLLEPTDEWPIWVDTSSSERNSERILKRGKFLSVEMMELSRRFGSFVDKLASNLGHWTIFLGDSVPSHKVQILSRLEIRSLDSNYMRAWLVVELLCTWEWSEGNAIKSVLPFMRNCTKNKQKFYHDAMLFDVLKALFQGTMKLCEKSYKNAFDTSNCQDNEAAYAEERLFRALLATLKTLFEDNGFWGKAEAEKLFREYLTFQEFKDAPSVSITNIAASVLNILMPFLRKKDTVKMGGLSTSNTSRPAIEASVCKWLEMALSTSDFYGHMAETECVPWLKLAVACFPLHSSGGAGIILAASTSEVTTEERSLLFALFQKLRSKTEAQSLHSTSIYGLQNEVSLCETLLLDMHSESTLASLMAAAVAYCWSSFDVEDWKFVLVHLYNWLEAAVLDIEELAELVADAARQGDGENAHEEIKSHVKISIEKIVNKQGKSSIELTYFAVCIFSEIEGLFTLEEGKQSLSVQNLERASWKQIGMRALEDILRLFLATGLVESALFLNTEAAAVISICRLKQSKLWESVADVVVNSSVRAREAAIRAADLWGIGKGSIDALYTLLFSPYPISSLQWAAYHFLSTDPLCCCAITWGPVKIGESLEMESEQILNGDTSITNNANIRPDLAAVLETSGVALLESPLTSLSRVNYFLAWSLFLTYLQSLTSLTSARERLVQYTQDSDRPNTLLDCLFQHIPLEASRSLSAPRKRNVKRTLSSSGVAESARRAASTGSVLFAVEGLWPVKEEEVAILSGAVYGLMLRVLPACVRIWFTGLRDRSRASAIEFFTLSYCSPELLAQEFYKVQAETVTDENLSIRANQSTREVTATYKKEEAGMDIIMKLPACYPLRTVEVDCTRRMGISENRLRKWILSMAAFLRNQNGAVAEAILVWRRNVDREFEGVEECPICYSIIHTSNHSLPRLACKTCKHKFHPACLYKWFSTSHKSTCPLCQTPF